MLIGIVEDELIIAEGISRMLETAGYKVLEPVSTYKEAIRMIEDLKPDMIIVDINIPGDKNGIDIGQKIFNIYKIPYIFLTAYSDSITLERAKEAHPNAYLVKPIKKEDLISTIEIAAANFSHQKKEISEYTSYTIKDALFIKNKKTFQKVLLKNILFLKSDNVYVIVHTIDQEYIVRSGLQQLLDEINSSQMIRVSRSYVVNIDYVETIKDNIIKLKNEVIPIHSAYNDEFFKRLKTI